MDFNSDLRFRPFVFAKPLSALPRIHIKYPFSTTVKKNTKKKAVRSKMLKCVRKIPSVQIIVDVSTCFTVNLY